MPVLGHVLGCFGDLSLCQLGSHGRIGAHKGTSCSRPCKPDLYGHYSFHPGRAATDIVEEGLLRKRATDDTGYQALQMHEEGRRRFCRKTV